MKIKSSDFLKIMPVKLHMKEQTARSLCLVGLIPWLVAQVCPLLSASDLGNLGNIGFLLTARQAGEEPGSWKLSSEAKQCGSKCLYPHVKMGFVTRPGVTPVLYSPRCLGPEGFLDLECLHLHDEMGSTIQSDSHFLFPQAKGSFNTVFDNFIKKKKNQFHGMAFSTCGALSSKFWFEVSGVRDVS